MAVSKMELLELVSKAEAGDVDFLREGVRVLAQALMEAEVSAQIGAEHGPTCPRPRDPPQRLPGSGLGHPGWHDRASDPEAASGQLPAVDAGTTPAG